MAVRVAATPDTLTWANYRQTDTRPLDDDSQSVDAFTKFRYEIPVIRVHRVGAGFDRRRNPGLLAFDLDGAYTIKISPKRLEVWKGVQQTAALLSHEQLHYDIGVVAARALIQDLAALRGQTPDEFRKAFEAAADLHFNQRSLAVNRQYDKDTAHGANPQPQKQWKDAMTTCLGGTSTTVMGLPL